MEEMLKYKEEGELPMDLVRARNIRNLAPQFTIVSNELYKSRKMDPY